MGEIDQQTPWPPQSPHITPLEFSFRVTSETESLSHELKMLKHYQMQCGILQMLDNTWREREYRLDMIRSKWTHVEIHGRKYLF